MRSLIVALLLAAIAGSLWYFLNRPKEDLRIYTWDTYVAPDLFKKFEKETRIRVIPILFYSNDELEAKLKTGAVFDLVMPSGNYVSRLVDAKLLQPLPPQIQALGAQMDAPVQHPVYDPDYKWSVPLFYGTTGIAVDHSRTSETITSWNQLFTRPAGEKPEIGMLDEVSTLMAVTSIAAGSNYCDMSPEILTRIEQMLRAQKPYVKSYEAEAYFEHLAADDRTLQLAWSGDAFIARLKNPNIQYIYPKEGVELWLDTMAIPANAPNPKAAAKFMEFVLKPENQAQYAEVSRSMPSVGATHAFLPEEMQTAPEMNVPPGTRAVISSVCAPHAIALYNDLVGRIIGK
ncbi:MAG: spermidine/putrescine ABC transporter substrate-binding protein [Micavibrio sp.]|nr:spermidine/putrescine ABC transporter substrate-binding protein [Micavibrio sp.]